MSTANPRTDEELITLLLEALADGRIALRDLMPVAAAPLGAGWRWVTSALQKGPNDPRLVPVARQLVALDPDFPSGQFLLGLACKKVGRKEEARQAFSAQLAAPSGRHQSECRTLLAGLGG